MHITAMTIGYRPLRDLQGTVANALHVRMYRPDTQRQPASQTFRPAKCRNGQDQSFETFPGTGCPEHD